MCHPSQAEVKLKKEPPHEGALMTMVLERMPGQPVLAADLVSRRVYLDANGNFDMTDDPAVLHGALKGSIPATGEGHWLRDVWVETPTWQARLVVDGKTYRLTLSGFSGGQIDGYDVMHVRAEDESLYCYYVSPPRLLRLNGHYYSVGYHMEGDGDGGAPVMRLEETKPELGRVALKGDVSTLYLRSNAPNAKLIFLENPAREIEAPLGVYDGGQCFYRAGTTARVESHLAYAEIKEPFEVKAGETASLAYGAPFTTEVTATLIGNRVLFGHRILGCGGEAIGSGATPNLSASSSWYTHNTMLRYG